MIRNPFHPDMHLEFNPYCKRKKQIITVGRLGTEEKNTEMLIEGFRKSEVYKHDWKLILVGSVEMEFRKWSDNFFEKYPDMKSVINFVGEVTDRVELTNILRESLIFCLPSRHEGFSLALIEAAICGCLVIGTDLLCVREITDNFSFGFGVINEDSDDLARKIIMVCNDPKMEEKAYKQYEYCVNNYSLEKVSKEIFGGLGI